MNQLGAFVPDLAYTTVKICTLLKKKNVFVWLEQHELEFEAAKALLCSDMLVKPFRLKLADSFLRMLRLCMVLVLL